MESDDAHRAIEDTSWIYAFRARGRLEQKRSVAAPAMRTLDGSVAEHLNRLLVGAIVVDEHELIVSKRACHVRYPGSQLPRSVAFEDDGA